MSLTPARRRIAGLVVAALVAAPAVALAPAAHAAAPAGAAPAPAATPVASTVDFDYLADVFPALEPRRGQHVFETITIERLKYLLRFEAGRYPVLVGDPKDPATQAEIGHIDAAARAAGVQKIYVFNPRIDGDRLNVFDWSSLDATLAPAGAAYLKAEGTAAQGGTLLDLVNGTSPDPEWVRTDGKVTGPYLVVLDKDAKDGAGNDDRVVASLAQTRLPQDLDTPTEQAEYESLVRATLVAGGAPDLSVAPQSTFYRDEVNRRHTASYPNAATHGGTILDESDVADWRVQQLTYPETLDLLSNPRYAASDVPLLFGGTWCHNTRAVLKDVNALARESGVRTVYNLDFSLFSAGNGGSQYDHIRTSGKPTLVDGKAPSAGYLYGQLFNTFLFNAAAEYAADGEPGASPNWYYPDGDTTQQLVSARRLQVPALLVHRQDHRDALGKAAPVVDQAIRTNDDGTSTEYMTEHWFVAGRDLPAEAGTPLTGGLAADGFRLANARNFASEAIGAYREVLGSLGSRHHSSATTVTVDGAGADLVPGPAPTISVQVTSPDYAPFVSFTANQANVEPSTGTGRPSGAVVVLDEAGQQVGTPTALRRDGSPVTITLPPITADQIGDVWQVRYLGRGYSIAPSAADLRIGKSSQVALAGATSTVHGTPVTLTATVTPGATGSVSLEGLPGDAITAPVVDGVATLTVPATLAAGAYTVRAVYGGDGVFSSSTSAATALTVTKVAAVVTVTAPRTTYGKPAKITVVVTDATGRPAAGKVTLGGAGAAVTATLTSAGTAVVALPKTLAVATYGLTARYAGSANVAGASATARLTVARGTVSRVAAKVTTVPTTRATGRVAVTVTTASGLATPTGKVTVTVQRGSVRKVVTATLRYGKATPSLPRLTKGTWRVSVSYSGSTTYAPASGTTSFVVTR